MFHYLRLYCGIYEIAECLHSSQNHYEVSWGARACTKNTHRWLMAVLTSHPSQHSLHFTLLCVQMLPVIVSDCCPTVGPSFIWVTISRCRTHTHTQTVVFMESLGFKSESDLPYLTLITVYDSQLRRWAGSAYLSVFFKGRGCGEKGRMWTGVNVQQTGFIMGLGIQCCQCLSKGRWRETLQFI